MADHHTPVQVDPREEERAREIWHTFSQMLKWSIVSIAGILILMTIAFIR